MLDSGYWVLDAGCLLNQVRVRDRGTLALTRLPEILENTNHRPEAKG
jgi:hypothetical protein